MNGGPVRWFRSHRENDYILHCGDGFYYNIRESKCRHYNSGGRGCAATASVSRTTGFLRHLEPHNHGPDPLLKMDFQLRREMVTEARRNVLGKKLRVILDEFRLRVRNPELARRFTRSRMCSALWSARAENYPPIPNTLLYLGVLLGSPQLTALCRTYDGQDYIFQGVVGCAQEKSVAIVFASGRMLQFLQDRESLHMDGTFKKRPRKPKMMQIFNIVVKYGDHIIGVVRILMRSRTTVAYIEVLRFLKTIAPGLEPNRVHCDFERAQINAVRVVFPLCRVVGCLWHYSVCVSRKSRKLGLAPLCEENDLVFFFVSCLSAVPLLPRCYMWQGVREIWTDVELSGWSNELLPLFQYFEQEWLPRFDELSVFGDPERTNNCSESDNRMLANAVPQNFPNVWALLGGFVQLEYIAWSDKRAIDELERVAPARRASALTNDRRVRRASQLLINRDITPGHFLRIVCSAVRAATLYGLQMEDESDSDSSVDLGGCYQLLLYSLFILVLCYSPSWLST